MVCYGIFWSVQLLKSQVQGLKLVFTAVTYSTRPPKAFYFPLKPEVFRGVGHQ